MNIPQIENGRNELVRNLKNEKSPRASLFLLYNYFDELLCLNDDSITESFLLEFLPNYKNLLTQFEPIGIEPTKSKQILEQAKIISDRNLFAEYKSEIKRTIIKIENGIKTIQNSLNGSSTANNRNSVLSFPVLENSVNNVTALGLIETFTIQIDRNTSAKKNNFIIVPSLEQVEKRLEEQIKISWQLAIDYLKKHFNKPYKHHTVVINFNKKHVQYEGFSLGMAITLGFLQELFRFYNTPLTLSVKGNVTFTGGLNSDGSVKSLSKEIIEKKVVTIFFSDIHNFALPEDDLMDAQNKLVKLKKKCPNRKLKLIAISDFKDLLNYRHILDIKKTKPTIRASKFINKNKYALGLGLILLGITLYYSLFTFDNNPHEFKVVEKTVHILNKHGNILWTTEQWFDKDIMQTQNWKRYHRIYDVDEDGTNEIFLIREAEIKNDSNQVGRIACFSNYGELKWSYNLKDKISNKNGEYKNLYYLHMIDIIEENNKPIIIAFAKHYLWSPSAIIKLDAKTGKRLDGTLWSQGHFHSGTVCDFNEDGDLEVIIGGINNAMKGAFALSVDIDSLDGQTPNNINNLFNNMPIGKFNKYLLLGKTDICRFYNNPLNGINAVQYNENRKKVILNVDEKHPTKYNVGPVYKFTNNFENVEIQIGDDFQFIRDSLVIKGLLNAQLTSSKEYAQILVDGIKEWDGEKFVKYEGQLIDKQ